METSILPPIGTACRGWKKCIDGVLVEVEIPADARRVAIGRRCKAEFVNVLQVIGAAAGLSQYGHAVYRVGEIVRAHDFSEDLESARPPCGINFYMDRDSAEAHPNCSSTPIPFTTTWVDGNP
jgi:Family of unknown function (DUF5758)